jgi:hypothetical protein
MKNLILSCLLLSLFACKTNPNESKECLDLVSSFKSATQGYFLNCMKSCFKISGNFVKDMGMKEKVRDSCDISCRDAIPYGDINNIKTYLESKYSCNFDYSASLGNPYKIRQADEAAQSKK